MRIIAILVATAVLLVAGCTSGMAYVEDGPDEGVFGVRVYSQTGFPIQGGGYIVDTNTETCALFLFDAGAVPVDCKKLGKKFPELGKKMTWLKF